MASSTIAPNYDATNEYTFVLVSQSSVGATYKVASRDLATPLGVEIVRKLTPANSTKNDHVQLRVFQTERNTTTNVLATAQVLVDFSIPKDTSILTQAMVARLGMIVGSILGQNNGAVAASATNVTALISGSDL